VDLTPAPTRDAVASTRAARSVPIAAPTIPPGGVDRPAHVLWLVILLVILED